MAIIIYIDTQDIDDKALYESQKYLTIIFLILLLLANGVLICVVLLRKRSAVLREPRFAIRLSLAIGGIIIALFTNIVFIINIFKLHSINCRTVYIAVAFDEELLSMVYGCGLILLAVDIIKRSTSYYSPGTTTNRSLLCVLLYAMLPWIISLAVVTPLVLINVNLEDWKCKVHQSKGHQQVRIVVSTILQAGLASIFGIFTLICSSSQHDGTKGHPDAVDHNSAIPDLDVKHISSIGQTGQLELRDIANKPHVTGYDDVDNRNNDSFENKKYTTARSVVFGQSESGILTKERIILLLSCIVYVITVVPFNALCLYIMETHDTLDGPWKFNYDTDLAVFIAYASTMWLRMTYPIILPLLWVVVSI